jgi:copper transport protein
MTHRLSAPHAPVPRPGARRRGLLRIVAALLVLAAALTGPLADVASAHASLVSVDPPDGARLDQGPSRITLVFSEAVSADLGGVRVIGPDGTSVHEGAAAVDRTTVTIGVADDLPDGTYVVSYRVISEDGHPVRGGSVFGVGDAAVDSGALGRVTDEGGDQRWEIVGHVGRAFAYGGVLLAAGGAAFLALAHRGGDERRRLERVILLFTAIGAVTSLVALRVLAALGTGQGPGSLFDEGVLGDVTAEGVGAALLVCVVGLAVLAGALRRWPLAAVVGGAAASASFALTGHTRVGPTSTLATVADVAHLLAVAVWTGGLVLLWWTLRIRRRAWAAAGAEAPSPDQVRDAGETTRRFSTLATGAIVAVGVAGGALSWSEVRSLEALTSTRYGLFLVAKVAVVVAIAVMGTYNHFRLVPAIVGGKARAGLRRLQQTLRFEVAALVVVVGLTSVLAVTTPARTSLTGTGVVEQMVPLEGVGSVQLVVSPARVGANQVHLYLYDEDGRPAEIAETVSLSLTLPAAQLGPIEREATRAGPAHLQLDGSDFAVAGDWQVAITVRVDRFTEVTGTTEVTISP